MRLVSILIMVLFSEILVAQDPNGNYNPYLNQGIIAPAPLWPVQANGTGEVRFNVGNSGSDPLEVFTDPDHRIILTISLSNGVPDHSNPLAAINGAYANLFSWSYTAGTYTGTQIHTIPSNSSGTITIAYLVSQNSFSPGSNGFNVNLTPAPYQTASNTLNDDAVSSYTYTEIRDYGDAPSSYGSAYHSSDNLNFLGALWDGETLDRASAGADGDDNLELDDEDGITFQALIEQGETTLIQVAVTGLGRLNAWIDWNGDGDFYDSGERIAENISRISGSESLTVSVPTYATVSNPTYARFRFSPGILSSSSGLAKGGEVEDYLLHITASQLAPTAPTGLKIESSTEISVSLSWDASSDSDGVTGYNIYRDGSYMETTTDLNYTDNTVSTGNSYTYAISVINSAGYESTHSESVDIQIDDISPPSVPTGLQVISASNSSVSLSWNAATDNVGVTGYRIYRVGSLLKTTTDLSYTDNTVTGGNSYSYTVLAIDAEGNSSEQSVAVHVNTNDTSPPTIPTRLRVTFASKNLVSLAWDAASDNVGVTGYRLYRKGVPLDTTSSLSYSDHTVSSGISYTYTVSAFDESGNASEQSSGVTVHTDDVFVDTIPPSPPTGLIITSFSNSSISLSWDESTDNVGVYGYKVYRLGAFLYLTVATSFTDQIVTEGYPCSYTISALDSAGNESQLSSEVIGRTTDTRPPTMPTGLKAELIPETGIVMVWDNSSDNVGVEGYRVYKNGIFLASVSETDYIDSLFDSGPSYSYRVSAYDSEENESSLSDPVLISTSSDDGILYSELSIFPNPSDGKIVVEIDNAAGIYKLEVIASTGALVIQKRIYLNGTPTPLTFGSLNIGIYYIRIFNNSSQYFGKILIVR